MLNCKGVLNIGGKTQSPFNFGKKYNKNLKKILAKKNFSVNPSMNISKLKKVIKK